MEKFLRRTWVEINLSAAEHNFKQIKKVISPKSKIMCVVKANAYGHGVEYLAKEYERLGSDWFAVSNIKEAIQLRENNITKPILILGYTPIDEAVNLSNFNITQAVISPEYAQELSKQAQKNNTKVNVHIKIDSGMGRIGFLCYSDESCNKTVEQVKKLYDLNGINIQGAFTHFSVSDDGLEGKKSTKKQFEYFTKVINKLKSEGYKLPICHCSNSGAIIDYPEMNLDMVRAGIILYGLMPSNKTKNKLNLKAVMQMKTVISQIKIVENGTRVSYGGTYVTKEKTKIATVPVGYADGYLRSFSNKAKMLVCEKEAPVIGRVCMDQTMLDVTGIDELKEDSIVTIFGEDGNKNISADTLANISGTINYEILCLVSKRVPRVYLKNGKVVGEQDYL